MSAQQQHQQPSRSKSKNRQAQNVKRAGSLASSSSGNLFVGAELQACSHEPCPRMMSHHHNHYQVRAPVQYAVGSILRKGSQEAHLNSMASSVSNEPHSLSYRSQKMYSRPASEAATKEQRHRLLHSQVHQQLRHVYGKVQPHQHQHHQQQHQQQAPPANEKQRLLFKRRKQQIQQHFDQRLQPQPATEQQDSGQYINVDNSLQKQQPQRARRANKYQEEHVYVPFEELPRQCTFRAPSRLASGEGYLAAEELPIEPIPEELDDELSEPEVVHEEPQRQPARQRPQAAAAAAAESRPEEVALAAIAALFKATAATAASAALDQQQQQQRRHQEGAGNTYQEIRRCNSVQQLHHHHQQQHHYSASRPLVRYAPPYAPASGFDGGEPPSGQYFARPPPGADNLPHLAVARPLPLVRHPPLQQQMAPAMLGKMMYRNLVLAQRAGPLAIAAGPSGPFKPPALSQCESLELRAYETAMRIMDSHVIGHGARPSPAAAAAAKTTPTALVAPFPGAPLVQAGPLPLLMDNMKRPGLFEKISGINLADFWCSLLLVAFLFAGAVVLIFSLI